MESVLKNIDIKSLEPIYTATSKLEAHVADVLERKYSMQESLFGHPLFFPMIGVCDYSPDFLTPVFETIKAEMKNEYRGYAEIIDGFSTKNCRPQTWRGNYLVFKEDTPIHVFVRGLHSHTLDDADTTEERVQKKPKTIFIDRVKDYLCQTSRLPYIVVNESDYQNVNRKITNLVAKLSRQ